MIENMKLRKTNRPGWFEIRSSCPICGEKTWCRINPKEGIVYCMRIPSDEYHDSTIGRQYKHKVDKTSIEPITPEESGDVKKKDLPYLDLIYQTMLSEMNLNPFHYENLTVKRKMTDEMIRVRQYRSLSADIKSKVPIRIGGRLRNMDSLLGVPGFYQSNGKNGPYWTMAGAEGMMIPFRSIRNEVSGFQIRLDHPRLFLRFKGVKPSGIEVKLLPSSGLKGTIVEEMESQNGLRMAYCELHINNVVTKATLTEKEKKSVKGWGEYESISIELVQEDKYQWWSSSNKPCGSSIGGPLPYHLALPVQLLDRWTGELASDIASCDEVWITEGPIKADKAADALQKPVIGLPGVGAYSLAIEPLKELGCKHVVLAIDADAAVNPKVAETLERCVEYFAKKTDMKLSLAIWDMSIGKGIDDLTDSGYLPQIICLVESKSNKAAV
ncbi:toprim domain-containing protein [Paenibacillus enshidis]|uniref:Toprim domain-containing protein n=1 Tax=Paenibacillus enshidis TaxID=1458439 RepID=A0ABV5AVH7_9BACL